jgi:hypothetical protein
MEFNHLTEDINEPRVPAVRSSTSSRLSSFLSSSTGFLSNIHHIVLDTISILLLVPHFIEALFDMGGVKFEHARDIPDLSGKVILVTGGM